MLSEAFRAVGTSTSHGSSPCSRRSTTTAISSSSTTLWAPESRKRLRVWSTSSPCPDFRCLRSCRPLTGDEAANQVKHFADVIHGEAEPICSGTDSKQCRWSTPSWSPPHWPARQHRELSQAAGEVKLIAGIHSHRESGYQLIATSPVGVQFGPNGRLRLSHAWLDGVVPGLNSVHADLRRGLTTFRHMRTTVRQLVSAVRRHC